MSASPKLILSAPQAIYLNELNTKFRAYVGGFGAGKTFVGGLDLGIFAGRHPGLVQGYFAPTYRDIRDTFWPTFEALHHRPAGAAMGALLAWAMPYLAAAGAALVALWAALAKARRDGARAADTKAKEADHARAREIEDAADRARRADDAGADPLGRLRGAGRLRD